MLDIDEMTVVGWELNHCEPHPMHIPGIIGFLGYVPENLFPATTVGQKIKRYQLLHGVSTKKLAKHLHIDESTLWRLENGRGKFFRATMKKLAPFLQSHGV